MPAFEVERLEERDVQKLSADMKVEGSMIAGTMGILDCADGWGWEINTDEVTVYGNSARHKSAEIAEAAGRMCAKQMNIDVVGVEVDESEAE